MAHDKLTPEQDRQRDQGHFNIYGMRNDPRDSGVVDGENRGDGGSARRFGSSGDESTYANRAPEDPVHEHPTGPIAAVDASGSARGLGLDYGGDAHKEPRLSSRQGAEVIGELDNRKKTE
ncbi:hypothetical protein [Paracidovorax valerianellae]|uniref:Uncharacterized protein n=1 Tax=Paracidovorax valerianellae TaxID=187868 RepID=A0A1G7A0P0_9BURK|nr:hypothetical protein [Paracidovorax valerianellae]MDA8443789.1 hypothetical protein [Paracidovorax valerianellae]SDE08301.1 hypothetical protein SAMN05192589_11223 [Paracidovorax valerianellae]